MTRSTDDLPPASVAEMMGAEDEADTYIILDIDGEYLTVLRVIVDLPGEDMVWVH